MKTGRIFILSLLAFCFFPSSIKASPNDRIDFSKFPLPYFSFESSNSFVSGKPAWITGYRFGGSYQQYSGWFGWYKLVSDVVENKEVLSTDGKDTITVPAQLSMNYKGIGGSYVYYQNDNWILSGALQLGFGKSYFNYYQSPGVTAKLYEHPVWMLELGPGVQYRFIKWIGIGGGIGYRIMLKDNPQIEQNFSTLNYHLGIKIYLDEVYKSVFPKGIHLGKNK